MVPRTPLLLLIMVPAAPPRTSDFPCEQKKTSRRCLGTADTHCVALSYTQPTCQPPHLHKPSGHAACPYAHNIIFSIISTQPLTKSRTMVPTCTGHSAVPSHRSTWTDGTASIVHATLSSTASSTPRRPHLIIVVRILLITLTCVTLILTSPTALVYMGPQRDPPDSYYPQYGYAY